MKKSPVDNSHSVERFEAKMNPLVLVLTALLSLAAGLSPHNQRILGGFGAGSFRGQQGPLVVTTTVTTVLDMSNGVAKTYVSPAMENQKVEKAGLHRVITDHDITVLKSSWDILKRRGNFAPKIYLRYFKAVPESQRAFPAFANISLSDLPNNADFLNAAYTSITSLNYIIPYLQYDIPGGCPVFPNLKSKYNLIDMKKLAPIWMTAMQEEMGSAFTVEVRETWKKSITALMDFVSN